jgi:hypothetical protein
VETVEDPSVVLDVADHAVAAVQLARRFSASSAFEAGLGGEDGDGEIRVGRERDRLAGQLEIADERVMDALDAGVVDAHVVRGPARSKRLASRRQLADEV